MAGVVHVVGSLNVDHPFRVARHPAVGETVLGEALPRTPGGKGLNQAVASARAGASVSLHGAVGDDEAGRWLTGLAADEGIDTTDLVVDPNQPTGQAQIVVADSGDNTVIVAGGANLYATVDPAALHLQGGDVVVTQLEVPIATAEAALSAAREAGSHGLFNPSPVGEGASLVPLASVVVVNEHEAAELSGRPPFDPADPDAAVAAGRALAAEGQTVVVTLGAQGAVVVGPDGDDVVPGIPVEAVDTTGAGDCFLGVLAASLADGRETADAVRRAVRASALSVTKPGATAAMPAAADIDA